MFQMHDGGTDVDPKKYRKEEYRNPKKPVKEWPDHWTQEQEDFAWSPCDWDSDPDDGEPNAH